MGQCRREVLQHRFIPASPRHGQRGAKNGLRVSSPHRCDGIFLTGLHFSLATITGLMRIRTTVNWFFTRSIGLPTSNDVVEVVHAKISVNHFDPETDQAPKENGVFRTKIRTKWYLVNISLFASDLIPKGYKNGEISSDLKRIGSRGRARTYNHTVNSRVLYH